VTSIPGHNDDCMRNWLKYGIPVPITRPESCELDLVGSAKNNERLEMPESGPPGIGEEV